MFALDIIQFACIQNKSPQSFLWYPVTHLNAHYAGHCLFRCEPQHYSGSFTIMEQSSSKQ